ncbi:MAG: LCP family protein [Lachnospirales bacterium]
MFKFLYTAIITLIIIFASIGIGLNAYDKMFASTDNEVSKDEQASSNETEEYKNINAVIVGVDELNIHTDTVIFANFDTRDYNIDLMSIPRDLKVTLTDEMLEELPNAPRTIKLTELYAYAGSDKAMEMIREVLSDYLGTDIEFWLKIDLDAFKYLVDEMGGVDFYVPMDMYYNDPTQNLTINLKEGMQNLDGDEAEQVIRFRSGYTNGDLGRIEVQQDFMQALLSQLLNSSNKLDTITTLAKTTLKYTENNVGILDITKYGEYVNDIDPDNVRSFAMPVTPVMIGGRSYVEVVDDEFEDTMEDILYIGDEIVPEEPEIPEVQEISAKELSIKVLNGTNVTGKASNTKENLESQGYTVQEIGNYDETNVTNTRIYIKEEGYGFDLVDLFNEPEFIVDENQVEDVIIVLGASD